MAPSPDDLLVSTPQSHVRLITLNRPKQLNALSASVLREIAETLRLIAAEPEVRVAVITGGDRVFGAGADLNEMAERDALSALDDVRSGHWEDIRRFPKPLIAAVNGYALGGGCELALHADIIVAGDTARFGQPEVNVGILPGAGGTQRLTRTMGKSLAMKLILTGEMIDAETALTSGLVAEVVPHEVTIERAIRLAQIIATKPPIAIRLAKEAVLRSYDMTLENGLEFERRAFAIAMGTYDKGEGVSAFLQKRNPKFEGR